MRSKDQPTSRDSYTVRFSYTPEGEGQGRGRERRRGRGGAGRGREERGVYMALSSLKNASTLQHLTLLSTVLILHSLFGG